MKSYLADYPAVVEFETASDLAAALADRSQIARLREAAWNARGNCDATRHGPKLARFLERLL
ncbi:MAG: hypothetical protein O2820_21620 [Planctomycetota bacterium]|nr:hypothetical protein [Planctomycetota bacterium]MDA1251817.1 hypothetical protein [Planctomycetota bacterium]